MARKANTYAALRERQQSEFNSFPSFYAFNDAQFTEGMAKLAVADKSELYRGIGGMFYRKTDAGKLHEMLGRLNTEMKEAFKDDDFLFDAFTYELANHEYCITYDETDALDALGLTQEEIAQDPRMGKIFLKAREDYMANAVC